jgi:hypothetical protein
MIMKNFKINNNKTFQILSDDYEEFKKGNNNNNLSILNIDIVNLTTSININN